MLNKVNAFYNDNSSSTKEYRPSDPYYTYLYGADGGKPQYNETTAASSSSSGSSSTGTVYNAPSGLRVRSGPGTNYSQIGSVWNGNSLTILKSQNGWHNINYNGNSNAWVSSNIKYCSCS